MLKSFEHKILFIILILITLNCSKKNSEYICKIVNIQGNVYEMDDNKNIISLLKKESCLKASSIIKTDNDSFADIQFNDNTRIRIQEDSIIKIDKFYQGITSEKTRIYIELGEAFAKLDNILAGKNIEIETETILIKEKNAEFIVSVSADRITKVAVYKGKLNYSTKINSEELKAIENKDPKTAEKIEKIINRNKTLEKNEIIEITHEDYTEYNAGISKIINLINSELNTGDNDRGKSQEILKKYTESLEELTRDTKLIKQGKLTDKDWDKILSSVKEGKTSLDIYKEDKYIWEIKKIKENPGLILTEKNTAITSDTQNLYISSNSNNAIFSINPAIGKTNWKFFDKELKNIYSMATPYMNLIILGTPDKIFIIDINGNKIMEKNVAGGLSYWSSPAISNNKIYIPSSTGIYEFNWESNNLIDKIPNISGQLYISADSDNLLIFDINLLKIKVYNLSDQEIIWESDKISNPAFMAPIFYKGKIFIADNTGYIYRFELKPNNIKPDILKIDSGVIVNLIINNDILYFLANNGYFYKLELAPFVEPKKIMRLEFTPDMNKFLTKKLLLANDEILYCSDTGKLFVYNIKSETAELISITENINKSPLISSPVMIGNVIFFMDRESNIYKRFKNIQ
ncbi:MAG: FecR domain-containing protein [Spirochaetes bacterium]|nr:FecR domain-containing protein [Spirochaetota bacterium]